MAGGDELKSMVKKVEDSLRWTFSDLFVIPWFVGQSLGLLSRKPTVSQRVRQFGYPVQEHHTTTQDGFNLTLHRIPYGKKSGPAPNKPVVLLQHGIVDTSLTYLAQSPADRNLPFLLADNGFDVYLADSRCNGVSVGHTPPLRGDSPDLWKWSIEQKAEFDVPAVINKALQVSQAKTLTYIGHSQGTWIAWAALCHNQETKVADKINLFISLAPVVYVGNITFPLLAPIAKLEGEVGFGEILKQFGTNEFPVQGKDAAFADLFRHFLADISTFLSHPSKVALVALAGGQPNHFTNDTLRFVLNYFPASTSVTNLQHWAQLINSKKFETYRPTKTSPNVPYDLTKIPGHRGDKLKVALYHGTTDTFSDPTDVEILKATLKHVNTVEVVKSKVFNGWGHGEFVWGNVAHKELYPDVIQLIKKTLEL